jgi:DNA-binding MarR family transcriptional regulator
VSPLHNIQPACVPDESASLERLFELAVLLTDGMESGLAQQGLTRARAEVIWRLHREGQMTQRKLSDELRCTPRNVTALVDALQENGFVARRPHPTDRRATLVSLTERGGSAAAAWQAEYRKLAAALLDGLSDAEVGTFLSTLDRVVERARAAISPQGDSDG